MKLIFLENELTDEPEDLELAKENLENSKFFTTAELENVEVVSGFEYRNSDEVKEFLFNKENIILTYSMYVGSSMSQLFYFLSSAGNNRIKDCTYIDCSGMIPDALNNNFSGFDNCNINVLQAIETNNILTFNNKRRIIEKVRIHFRGKDESIFFLETASSYISWQIRNPKI